MTIRKVTMAIILIALSSVAFTQETQASSPSPDSPAEGGTPEQQAACRPDVRRFCRAVSGEAGPFAFLACLQEHREKLSRACRDVLESNGQ